MIASQDCIDLIKRFEGFRSKPYMDPAGLWTIGWGHRCAGPQVGSITEDEGEMILRRDLTNTEDALSRVLKVPVSQSQFDALVCFAYNCRGWADSTLLKLINAGKPEQAAEEFPKWNHGGGKVLKGLTARRDAERRLFLAGMPQDAPEATEVV